MKNYSRNQKIHVQQNSVRSEVLTFCESELFETYAQRTEAKLRIDQRIFKKEEKRRGKIEIDRIGRK